MEHINFKEKFTKNVYRQTASIFKLWDGGGGGAKKNLHHLHPLFNSLYSPILKFISQKKVWAKSKSN